jgi:hypothetical protein
MAWRHETFDNLSIPVPTNTSVSSVILLLKKYLAPEMINGYICDKCTTLYAQKQIQSQIQSQSIKKSPKKAKKAPLILDDLQKKLNLVNGAIELQNYDLPKEIGAQEFKVEVTAMKETALAYLPSCLCLHMQRSVYLPSGRLIKNNVPVNFPMELDLTEFVIAPNQRIVPYSHEHSPEVHVGLKGGDSKDIFNDIQNSSSIDESKGLDNAEIPIVQDAMKKTDASKPETQYSFLSDFLKEDRNARQSPYIYKLKAVILHYGHHESGHFIALRRVKYKSRRGIQEAWFRVSDASVERIEDIDHEISTHGSRYVYMLFYER